MKSVFLAVDRTDGRIVRKTILSSLSRLSLVSLALVSLFPLATICVSSSCRWPCPPWPKPKGAFPLSAEVPPSALCRCCCCPNCDSG